MKKSFFQKRRALVDSRLFSFTTILVFVGVLFAFLRVVTPSTFFTLTGPFFRVGAYGSALTSDFMAGFARAQVLTRERDTLAQQNQSLIHQNAILAARVHDLVKLVGTSTAPLPAGIVADVLARPPESPYDTLVIDAGKGSGIAVGDPVYAEGGIPAGHISSVSASLAQVELLSSPHASTTAWVGPSRIPISLVGEGGGSFTARVPRATPISLGDSVFVAGKGIRPVGTVVRIDAEPANVTETLRIRPLLNPLSLTVVDVIPRSLP